MKNNTQYELEKEFLNYIIHKDYYKFLKSELTKYVQHGKTNVFKHGRAVAYNSFKLANALSKSFNIGFDMESLVDAGYMHDMFMYDWHEKGRKS